MLYSRTTLAGMITLGIALSSAALVAPGLAQDKPIPVPTAPIERTYKSIRGELYCEVWLFSGSSDTRISAAYFNTSDLNNDTNENDSCPASMWDKVTVKSLETQYDVIAAYKYGPRSWTMDYATFPVGPVVTFDAIQARWMGQAVFPIGATLKAANLQPYRPLQLHRKSAMTFEKGKPVFVLEDPDGASWVMQAFSKTVDRSLTYASLQTLGEKLKAGKGWKYRAVILDKDLTISTPEGYNWILQDELQNSYVACKDDACSFTP